LINADLHIHTNYSPDATNQPKTIVEKLNKHPTTKAIAITDHNTCQAYPILQELAKPYPDILIIPGIEISAEEGELIILGITEPPPKPWKAQTLIDYANDNNAVTIAPHPYRGYGLADQIQTLNLTAIETLNGITEPHLNRKAEQTAKTRNLPQVAGSDSHDPKDPWNVYTQIQATSNIDDILNAIKRGNTKPCTIDKSIRF
jgi:predicted metal-dependent phosphoesterase TrpH